MVSVDIIDVISSLKVVLRMQFSRVSRMFIGISVCEYVVVSIGVVVMLLMCVSEEMLYRYRLKWKICVNFISSIVCSVIMVMLYRMYSGVLFRLWKLFCEVSIVIMKISIVLEMLFVLGKCVIGVCVIVSLVRVDSRIVQVLMLIILEVGNQLVIMCVSVVVSSVVFS